MSEPKTKIVHFRVPAELFDWSQRFWQSRGWSLAQYMRMLMLAQQERCQTMEKDRPAIQLLAIATEGERNKQPITPAVEPNGH